MTDVTQILRRIEQGDAAAAEQLFARGWWPALRTGDGVLLAGMLGSRLLVFRSVGSSDVRVGVGTLGGEGL